MLSKFLLALPFGDVVCTRYRPKNINICPTLPTCLQMVLFDAGSAPSASSSKPMASDRFEHDSRGRSVSRLVIRNIEHSHAGVYTCQPASADAVDVTVHVLNGTVLAVATDGAVFNRFVANFPTLSLALFIGNFPPRLAPRELS